MNALMKQLTRKLNSNLTCKEHIAMEKLPKNKNVIITNADQDGAVFITFTNSYIKEANR